MSDDPKVTAAPAVLDGKASDAPENWFECCPLCGCRLLNHNCRFVCSNPECHFFMSCSEFDL
jgi:hypothetical protein